MTKKIKTIMIFLIILTVSTGCSSKTELEKTNEEIFETGESLLSSFQKNEVETVLMSEVNIFQNVSAITSWFLDADKANNKFKKEQKEFNNWLLKNFIIDYEIRDIDIWVNKTEASAKMDVKTFEIDRRGIDFLLENIENTKKAYAEKNGLDYEKMAGDEKLMLEFYNSDYENLFNNLKQRIQQMDDETYTFDIELSYYNEKENQSLNEDAPSDLEDEYRWHIIRCKLQ